MAFKRKGLNKQKLTLGVEGDILVQNRSIIFLLVVLIFVVAFFGTSVNSNVASLKGDFNSLNATIFGIYNNNQFSEVIGEISDSVFLILTPPTTSSDGINVGDTYVDDNGVYWNKGTGFAVSDDGWIITAGHVIRDVKDPRQMKVLLFDERGNETEFQVEFGSSFDGYDLGILKVQGKTKPVTLSNSLELLPVGSKVGFTGFPSQEDQSAKITHDGIISHSEFKIVNNNALPEYNIHSFVNSGQSGGPVFLADSGEVVGFIISRKRASQLPQISYADKESLPQDVTTQLLADIYNRQNEMYNLLANEISVKTQMGVGVVVGINQDVVNQLISQLSSQQQSTQSP